MLKELVDKLNIQVANLNGLAADFDKGNSLRMEIYNNLDNMISLIGEIQTVVSGSDSSKDSLN